MTLETVPQKAAAGSERRFFYGWVIVGTGLFVSFFAYGIRYSFSVLFPSLLEELRWSRDATAAMLSFHLLAYGLTAPAAGMLVERLRPRRAMGLGALLLALGAAASSLGQAPWHYYLTFGLLTGAGLCLTGAVPFVRVLANWFVARRALALSIMNFGAGGAFLLYPVIALLVEKVGWRNTFLVEGAFVAGLLLPAVVLFVRYHPGEMGLLPDGRKEPAEAVSLRPEDRAGKSEDAPGWTLSRAARSFRFWALCFCAFAGWGLTQHILVTHHIAFARDAGYSQVYAATVLALFGLFLSLGNLSGFISDRIGREVTFSIGTAVGFSGIVFLMLIQDASQPWMLYAYSILYGFGYGLTMPTIAAAATDMFQGKGAGMIIGLVWSGFALGGTIGPWLGGVIFEAAGSYLPAFQLAAGMFLLGAVAFWLAAPRKSRQSPVASRQSPVDSR